MKARRPRRSDTSRWQGALELLRLVRLEPGVTRADAARTLGLSSGSAAEITARLRSLSLVDEQPVSAPRRGRPTMALGAAPSGPLVLALDIRHADWRLAVGDLAGTLEDVAHRHHADRAASVVLKELRKGVAAARRTYGHRIRVLSVVVPGTVQDDVLVQASALGWRDVDLGQLQRGVSDRLPLLVGNDATLAGVAEARRTRHEGTLLYLTIEVGLGGILVVDGQPASGARGAGGEFGHLPFADARLACPCGAHGCWDVAVDGRAMARHRRHPEPADPYAYAVETLALAASARPDSGRAASVRSAARAVTLCASTFGRGVAGLVNALDPSVVALGGLAVPLNAAAPEEVSAAYMAGLMAFRRREPPALRPAVVGPQGPLVGAADVGWDVLLTEAGLIEWERLVRPGS